MCQRSALRAPGSPRSGYLNASGDVEFPAEQTCCGQMHFNSGYAPKARLRAAVRRCSAPPSGGLAVGLVRRDIRDAHPRPDGDRGRRRGSTSSPSSWSTCSASRTSAPTSRTGSPTTRPATGCGCCGVGDRPLRLLRAVRGIDLVELPGRRGVLRVRRHVRGEERRDVSMAMLGDKLRCALDTGAEVLRRGRQLVPDAHRRRRCTRQSAPASRTIHLAEILRRTEDGGAAYDRAPTSACRRSRRPRAAALRRRAAARATWAGPPTRSATSGRGRRRAARLGSSCARPGRRSRTGRCATSTTICSSSRQRSTRGGRHRALGAPTPPRPTGSSPRSCRATARREVVKVKSMTTEEIGLNEALAAAGHHAPTRPTWPS